MAPLKIVSLLPDPSHETARMVRVVWGTLHDPTGEVLARNEGRICRRPVLQAVLHVRGDLLQHEDVALVLE